MRASSSRKRARSMCFLAVPDSRKARHRDSRSQCRLMRQGGLQTVAGSKPAAVFQRWSYCSSRCFETLRLNSRLPTVYPSYSSRPSRHCHRFRSASVLWHLWFFRQHDRCPKVANIQPPRIWRCGIRRLPSTPNTMPHYNALRETS